MQYRLRTLLILLAVAPPLLAGVYFIWPHRRQISAMIQSDDFSGLLANLTTIVGAGIGIGFLFACIANAITATRQR